MIQFTDSNLVVRMRPMPLAEFTLVFMLSLVYCIVSPNFLYSKHFVV